HTMVVRITDLAPGTRRSGLVFVAAALAGLLLDAMVIFVEIISRLPRKGYRMYRLGQRDDLVVGDLWHLEPQTATFHPQRQIAPSAECSRVPDRSPRRRGEVDLQWSHGVEASEPSSHH